MLLKPPRVQRSSNSEYHESRRAISVDSGTSDNNNSGLEYSRDSDLPTGKNLCKEDSKSELTNWAFSAKKVHAKTYATFM